MSDSKAMIAEEDELEIQKEDGGEEIDVNDSADCDNLQSENDSANNAGIDLEDDIGKDAEDDTINDPEDDTINDPEDDTGSGPENDDDVIVETVDLSLQLGDATEDNVKELLERSDVEETDQFFVNEETVVMDEVKDENAEDVEGGEEDDGDEEEEEDYSRVALDPNVMPQVNAAVLAKRKWQVKVYPLKPADFGSGYIANVFKNARESLLYLISAGKYARGKGEMYISTVSRSMRVVQGLMRLDSHFPEMNIEVVKKNDEGVIEEKAYMRFDTRMVRMLFVPMTSVFQMPHSQMHGRKRERLIGSVFVKNLPAGTTKDMLRVMFPFAEEINYNPEKFKEGTARLVLKTRNTVIPCLKAFAKVELGGNILELHPLERKKRRLDDDQAKPSFRHHSKSESAHEGSGKEDEGEGKSVSKLSVEKKKEGSKSKKSESNKAGNQKEGEGPSIQKEAPKKGKEADKNVQKPLEKSAKDIKNTARRLQNKRAGLVSGQDRMKFNAGFRARQNPGKSQMGDSRPLRGGYNRPNFRRDNKDISDNRRNRISYNRNRLGSFGNSGDRNANASSNYRNRTFGGGANRNLTSARRTGWKNKDFGDRRMNTDFALKSDLGVNAGATQDMMMLQNQLSMAINSQLAMLNETQMAVEHAKRGASELGLGSEFRAGSSSVALGGGSFGGLSAPTADYSIRDDGGGQAGRIRSRDKLSSLNQSGGMGRGYSHKRNADQAGLRSQYNQGSYSSKRSNNAGTRGQYQKRGPKRGGGSGYTQQQNVASFYAPSAYDVDAELEEDYSDYNSRSLNAFSSGGRKNSANFSSGYRY